MPENYVELPSSSSDYSWSPAEESSWDIPSTNTSSDFSFQDNNGGWFTDSTTGTTKQGNTAPVTSSMTDDVWKWITSNQGASTIGGAAQGIMQAWAASNAADAKSKESALDREAAMAIAMLKENRIAKHNESINKPANLGLVNFKR